MQAPMRDTCTIFTSFPGLEYDLMRTFITAFVTSNLVRFSGLALASCCVFAGAAHGTRFATNPRRSILLEKSAAFVVVDAWNSVTMYRLKDGKAIHKFP